MISFDKKNIRSWSLLGLAPSIFINAMTEIMDNDSNVYLITADTGRYCGFQKLDRRFDNRIINVGIAEQNMIGVAAGLALEGKKVFVTTYAPFLMFRCADHIRHLVGNCNLDIKLIGTAAGFTAANSGTALQAINDIAFARAIPNMTVLSPADCTEAMKMMLALGNHVGPAYMRFCGLTNLPSVYNEDFDYRIGKANELRQGTKIAILATGTSIVTEALKAQAIIEEKKGITATLIDVHTLKPLDKGLISRLQSNYELIVTVEEHSVIGGLGSAVLEALSNEKNKSVRVVRIGVEDELFKNGDRNYMLQQCGLKHEMIADRIIKEIEGENDVTKE